MNKPTLIAQKNHGLALRIQTAIADVGAPDTLERLGPWLGVSVGCAWNWRTGEKIPTMRNALMLSQRLGVCVEWLLTGRGPKRPLEALPESMSDYMLLDQQNREIVDDLIRGLLRAQSAPDTVTPTQNSARQRGMK